MTSKFNKFVDALEALCKEHDVYLTATELEGLEVDDLCRHPNEGPLGTWIADETGSIPVLNPPWFPQHWDR